jgi:hypothetical protein
VARNQFSNNALATLASSIGSTATALSVTAGFGALFPALAAGQQFIATLMKAGAPATLEIILCTARSGDNFTTIVRAQEGTTALSWSAGDTVALLPTAGGFAAFAQTVDLQATSLSAPLSATSSSSFVTAMTLTLPLGIYKLSALLAFFQASAGNAGVSFQVVGGTATVSFTNLFGAVNGSVNGAAISRITSNTASFIAASSTSNTDYLKWDVDVNVTAAGTVVLQFAQNVSSAITSTLAQGSSLAATKIG